jgi:three-Cys-motif partner protein
MALKFVQDAISLSGLTGSKLKCEIIGQYYPFWWNITSGGPSHDHGWPTAIIELDAATGEMYIEDTGKIILGSAGHAMDLKCNDGNTRNLKIVLVEKDVQCYSHLKKVISRRWPKVDIAETEGQLRSNRSNIFLVNAELDEAIRAISQLDLGSGLFFFDPLRRVAYEAIDKVAKARIKTYYQTGTEFIIFVFTSDWFLGRDDFAGLPATLDEASWSKAGKNTVGEADTLFGTAEWRTRILNNKPIYEREHDFIELYKINLHKWFRYVLPMPFNPKDKQIFHLILCSNFEVGVRAARGFFCDRAKNLDYKPDNRKAYFKFGNMHEEIFEGLRGNQRPKQWLILWKTITGHEEGICDYMCRDFKEIEQAEEERIRLLEWLAGKGYMTKCELGNPWNFPITQYRVNWQIVKELLNVEPPAPLEPLSLKPLSLKEISR